MLDPEIPLVATAPPRMTCPADVAGGCGTPGRGSELFGIPRISRLQSPIDVIRLLSRLIPLVAILLAFVVILLVVRFARRRLSKPQRPAPLA